MSITIHSAITVPEGDGVTVKRLMPVAGLRNFDPFVLWDHFDISGGGFPDHPHRGFEAITWLFDGGMNHTDNLGNRGTVHAGGAQHFTAGAGIIHSEFPDGRAHGIQLWINLPKRLKSIAPDYQQAEAESVRTNDSDGVTTRHIAGRNGAIQLHSDIAYQQIDLAPGASCLKTVTETHRGFIYLVAGELWLGEHRLTSGDAACIEDETSLALHTKHGAQLMWCFGKPHHEPIHQHGPFVD